MGTRIINRYIVDCLISSMRRVSVAVPCGLNVSCADHRPIPVEVEPGRTVTHIDPCDFYSQKSVPQT